MDLIGWILLTTCILFMIGFGLPLIQLAISFRREVHKPSHER